MKLSKELVLHAFSKYIESTISRYDVPKHILYTETLKFFDDSNVQVPICMFIYGYVKAMEPLILDKDIEFDFIKEIVLLELKAKQ